MSASLAAELRKFVAPEVVFGLGARGQAGRYARNLGMSKALLVTDGGVRRAGWADQVAATVEAAGIDFTLFTDVTPNPRAEEIMAGARRYTDEGCSGLIAVGGGSPIDCAKGIGVATAHDRHILEFEGVDHVTMAIPPLVCIPTTGGTSADVSQFAIIIHESQQRKVAVISKAVVPDVALIDPETLTTMPRYLAACTAVDALVHAIEAFVSNASSPLTDLHALEAIRLISTYAPQVVDQPDDLELWSGVMLGSFQAGLAFSNASLGATHAMAHSLGGYLDLPHGECNALLVPHVTAFNHEAVPERFEAIGRAMGQDLRGMNRREQRTAVCLAVDHLRRGLGIDRTLASVGVKRSDVPALAENAMRDPCMVTNPRRPNRRDVEVVYAEAL